MNCRFRTSAAQKGRIVQGCAFLKCILNVYEKTGGKKMHSLGSKKLNYNFMCKKLSHLGTICSTGLFYFIEIKVKNLTASVLLQSWKLMFSHVSVTVCSNFCILVASFQWVYFDFQILAPCELAFKWLILKLQQFLVILLEQWLAWQFYLICALLFRIGSVSAEPLPASHVNTGGQIVRLILLVTASECSRVNFMGVLFWSCYEFFFKLLIYELCLGGEFKYESTYFCSFWVSKQNTHPLGSGWERGELEQGLALWYGIALYQLWGWSGFVWHKFLKDRIQTPWSL